MDKPLTTAHTLLQRIGRLSVVIPAFNEEARLPSALEDISAFLRSAGIDFEIVVVDDGSTDNTRVLLGRLEAGNPQLRSIHLSRNRGKGAAVKAGVLAAVGSLVLFTDADQSTSIDQLSRLVAPMIEDGFHIAMGSRALAASRIVVSQKWYRQLLGKGFGRITRLLLVRGFGDCQCGFKCFRADAARRIFMNVTSDSAIFDMEVMYLAAREAFTVAEVAVEWRHDPDSRLSYNFPRAIGLLRELLRMRRHWKVRLPLRVMVTKYGPPASEALRDGLTEAKPIRVQN